MGTPRHRVLPTFNALRPQADGGLALADTQPEMQSSTSTARTDSGGNHKIASSSCQSSDHTAQNADESPENDRSRCSGPAPLAPQAVKRFLSSGPKLPSQGVLFKVAKRTRLWQQRFYILQQQHLIWFQGTERVKASGVLMLHSTHSVEPVNARPVGLFRSRLGVHAALTHGFRISIDDVSSKSSITLYAEDAATRDDWVNAVRQSIARAPVSSPGGAESCASVKPGCSNQRSCTQTQPAPLKLKLKPTMHLTPDFIQTDVIGSTKRFQGPFGERTITYADYTASGRGLACIENFMRNIVLPMYANTHTEVSATGLQTTVLREEARRAIMDSCNAHPEHDTLIFIGSGATGAIHRMTTILGLKPRVVRAQWNERGAYISPLERESAHSEVDRPLVVLGPFEHHSNELVWRELNVDLYVLDEDDEGRPDLKQLQIILEEHQDRSLKIGSFCAGSNVTGILPDCDELARVMHRHGGLAFFDYAGSGPYVDIDMNPSSDPEARKDAIFLSPHKIVGGPGSSGVLLVKRSLCTNPVPSIPGGGTVAFVTEQEHHYSQEIEHREEGGTPGIPQCIRAGLAFKVKDAVGAKIIEARESKLAHMALRRWKAHPHVQLIGDDRAGYWDEHRLSIVSFNVHTDRAGAPGRRLHCHFVSQVLNDLFGLQSRSGCSCAGPYGLRLMGISREMAAGFSMLVKETSMDSLKIGWARVNFNYFISDEEAEFIIRAVEMVADHGWKLLPYYSMDTKTGQWHHRLHGHVMADTMAHLDIPTLLSAQHAATSQAVCPAADRLAYLEEAERVFARAHEAWLRGGQEPQDFTAGSEWPAEAAKYQTFVLPSELRRPVC